MLFFLFDSFTEVVSYLTLVHKICLLQHVYVYQNLSLEQWQFVSDWGSSWFLAHLNIFQFHDKKIVNEWWI